MADDDLNPPEPPSDPPPPPPPAPDLIIVQPDPDLTDYVTRGRPGPDDVK